MFFVFEENPQTNSSCLLFSSDSALETIDAEMFFYLVFLKMHKTKLLEVKNGQNTVLIGTNFFSALKKIPS